MNRLQAENVNIYEKQEASILEKWAEAIAGRVRLLYETSKLKRNYLMIVRDIAAGLLEKGTLLTGCMRFDRGRWVNALIIISLLLGACNAAQADEIRESQLEQSRAQLLDASLPDIVRYWADTDMREQYQEVAQHFAPIVLQELGSDPIADR
ncbi:MAG TPA: hypothetical protein PKL83_04635 [bacterium]|nr:hypothetical protein [bacterium]